MSHAPEDLSPVPLAGFALAALLPLPLLAMGVLHGGLWLWAAFLYMGFLTIVLDQLAPLASGAADGAEFPAADLLLVSVAIGELAALPVVVWAVAGDSGLATGERVLLYFAAAFWFGQVAHRVRDPPLPPPDRARNRTEKAILCGEHQVPDQAEQAEREGSPAQQGCEVRAQDAHPQVPRGCREPSC